MCEIILKYEDLFYQKVEVFYEKLTTAHNKLVSSYQFSSQIQWIHFNIMGVMYKWLIRYREDKKSSIDNLEKEVEDLTLKA